MRVSVVTATMNEIDGVRATLPRIDRRVANEIIVVDLHSADGTVEYAESIGCRVVRQQSRGYANAFKEGIASATGDVIVEFQPDGNSLPEKIPELVAKLAEGYDLVIASRYLPGAKSEDDDQVTALGNHGFTLATNLLFGTSITDALIGFRAFRKSAYDTLRIDATGLEWCIQLPVQFAKRGYRIAEIPATEPKRIGGVRKMHPFRTGLRVLAMLLKETITR